MKHITHHPCWMMGDDCGVTVVVVVVLVVVVAPDPNLKRKPSPVCPGAQALLMGWWDWASKVLVNFGFSWMGIA